MLQSSLSPPTEIPLQGSEEGVLMMDLQIEEGEPLIWS